VNAVVMDGAYIRAGSLVAAMKMMSHGTTGFGNYPAKLRCAVTVSEPESMSAATRPELTRVCFTGMQL
jgi:hypothetical protein